MRKALVVGALALALAGCAGSPAATTSTPPPLAEGQQAHTAPLASYGISIPKIGMSSSLIPLRLNPDGTIQVPPLDHVEQAGVYANGPKPGQPGPAVILCHVNGGGKPGCGAHFAQLAVGDRINVDTPSGAVAFQVTDAQTVSKADFPTAKVYSDTAAPELRLITCGPGAIVGRDYVNQTVIWAKKVGA